jgi:signal transduction histidine kinase
MELLRQLPCLVLVAALVAIAILFQRRVAGIRLRYQQVQYFADITSQLLGGVEVKSLCNHIARVITEATTFRRAAIWLAGDDRHLTLAGQTGLNESEVAQLRDAATRLTIPALEQLCRQGRPLSKAAVLLAPQDAGPLNVVRSQRRYAPSPMWTSGNEVSVPLCSPRGNFVGIISLDDPRRPEDVKGEPLSKLDMLAANIAVAADNAAMQRQLLMTEKLAGLGQLVRGVGHEMNNPLTAVLGYSELLMDRTSDPEMQHGLGVIRRESQRIKSILANLQRFAQQDYLERKHADLLPLLRDILDQKSVEARAREVELVEELAPMLPPVAFDEVQLKQVFLQVLTNALDAVQGAQEKRVTVAARAEDKRVMLSFVDTGPGFADLNRVFDPFFTTKMPGKGTGLGLSICYGVLKQHGGNITAHNLEPAGACVVLELPIAREAGELSSVLF